METEDRAIVVGITHYPGLNKGLSDLEGSENDAMAFKEWLLSPAGGNMPEGNIRLIRSSDYEKATDPAEAGPTLGELTKAIDEMYDLGRAQNSRAGRRLYLFLAGHGVARRIHEAALIMANAVEGRTYKIPGEPYAEWFKESAFFDEVVLFMDCCLEDDKLTPSGDIHLNPVSGGKRRARYYYVLAAELGQSSEERRGRDGKMRGVFSSALLAGLWQGPPDGGDVTGSWLEDFIPQYMTKLLGGPDIQDPQFFYQRNKDIIFVNRAQAPVQSSVATGLVGLGVAAGKPAPAHTLLGQGRAVERRAETGVQVDIHTERREQGQVVEQHPEASFRVRIRTGPEGRSRDVKVLDGLLNSVPPKAHSGETWEWELGPGLYAYCYAGDEVHFLALMGEGEEIDVQL